MNFTKMLILAAACTPFLLMICAGISFRRHGGNGD